MAVTIKNGNRANLAMQITNISVKAMPFSASVIGYNKGINMGGASSLSGDNSVGYRHLIYGIEKNIIEGSPSSPCLEIKQPGCWRFRWSVKAGQRRISIRVKQIDLFLGQRPTLVVKANSDIGILSDLSATAPIGNDWVIIGPITFTATGTGMVWVETWNNLNFSATSAYFDHISVS